MADSNPAGLRLRGGIWHIDRIVRAGRQRRRLRETTGCTETEREAAAEVLQRRIEEVRAELLHGPTVAERTFDQAAVEYTLALERRGKDTARAEQDLRLVSPWVGALPLSHVHQGTLRGFEAAQRGVRRSSTVARVYRTVVAVLNHAARTLRDGPRPWLSTAVPRIEPPDWGDTWPPHRLTWDEQDRLLDALDRAQSRHLVPMALLAVSTGAREAEVCQLQWAWEMRVHGLPRGAVWRIPPTVRKANAQRSASRQQPRYLVCNATARRVLDAQRGNGAAHVFLGPRNRQGQHRPVARLNNTAWRRAWARSGLPTDGVKKGPHNMRHTYGERLEAVGAPWEVRKVLLGHELADVTAHYSAPGLARLLHWAEQVSRETAPSLRPVSQIAHNASEGEGESAASA